MRFPTLTLQAPAATTNCTVNEPETSQPAPDCQRSVKTSYPASDEPAAVLAVSSYDGRGYAHQCRQRHDLQMLDVAVQVLHCMLQPAKAEFDPGQLRRVPGQEEQVDASCLGHGFQRLLAVQGCIVQDCSLTLAHGGQHAQTNPRVQHICIVANALWQDQSTAQNAVKPGGYEIATAVLLP
jgi:hypothetical protein